MTNKIPVEVRDAIYGCGRATRSIGLLVQLLDATNDSIEIVPGDLADLLAIIHEDMERQDNILEVLIEDTTI